ncbi:MULTISPECIES: hypothetical protein [unclassified Spirosoma]|jgi:hypothetical protein|uniref:hypothetical protein n=1 Tax=unclassified Spirosoma TaxID=2621999 RepID=UPI000967E173|nr:MULTISPECIES: hypothetical protein [unclassified Spirosoma]MBN8826899.1 hypothetical protein [Spirosoma sp.]OJW72931.1 MAG: hypothetical protein BGO59_09320 [Spirosoma sp. 48-14]
MKADSIQLTTTGNQLQVHVRDGIKSIRIDSMVREKPGEAMIQMPLLLTVLDEAELVIWNEEIDFVSTGPFTVEAITNQRFAVWEHLTIRVSAHPERSDRSGQDFSVYLFFTLNPDDESGRT